MKDLTSIFNLFNKNLKLKAAFLIFLIFLNAFSEMLSISLLIPLFYFFIDNNQISGNYQLFFNILAYLSPFHYFGEFEKQTKIISGFFILFFLFFALRILFNLLFIFFNNKFMNNLSETLITKSINGYFRLPSIFTTDENISKHVFSSFYENSHMASSISLLLNIFAELLIIFSICIVLLFYNWNLTLIIIVTIIFFGFLIMKVLKNKVKEFSRIRREKEEQNLINLNQLFSGYDELKSYKVEDFFIDKYTLNLRQLLRTLNFKEVITQLPRFFIEFIVVLILTLSIIFSLYLDLNIKNVFFTMVVYLASFLRIYPSLNKLLSSYQSYNYLKPFIKSALGEFKKFKFYDEKKTNKFNVENFEKLLIQNLNYSYNDSKLIFRDTQLTINKYDKIGIQGSSGSGKTTLIKILSGQVPVKCDLIIDDKKISINQPLNIGKISYVPQKVHIINAPLYKNIALGLKDDDIDFDRVKKCLMKAQLRDFLCNKGNLNLNYEITERGLNLSGGQIQRIGLARALYHDSDILIFDEATNSLDEENEKKILKAIDDVSLKKTVIFISHNLKVLKNCNKHYIIKFNQIHEKK